MSRQSITFTTVDGPYWTNKPVVIVGGGASLEGFDFNRLKDSFYVLTVNGSIFDIPWADAGFSSDRMAISNWWTRFCNDVSMPLHFAVPFPWIENVNTPPSDNMKFHTRIHRNTFQKRNDQISSKCTSGFGALNLAWLKKAKKIVLLGFDYGPIDEKWHHNQQHYNFKYTQRDDNWQRWAKNFNYVSDLLKSDGVEVINASPNSRIKSFPCMTIDEALL